MNLQNYRKLAKKFHPDNNPKAERDKFIIKFGEIWYAFVVLSGPVKRATYDRYGLKGLQDTAAIPNIGYASFYESQFEQNNATVKAKKDKAIQNLSNESETDGSPSKEQNDNITKPMDTSDAVRVAP